MYRNFLAHLRAAEAPADKTDLALDSVYIKYPTKRGQLLVQERGELAEEVASAKFVLTEDLPLDEPSFWDELLESNSDQSRARSFLV